MYKILSFQRWISINVIKEILYIPFSCQVFNTLCVWYMYSASRFGLYFKHSVATLWLVAAWWSSTSLLYGLREGNSGWQDWQTKFEAIFGGPECRAEAFVESGQAKGRHRRLTEYKSNMVGVIRKINLAWLGETKDGLRGNQLKDCRIVRVEKRMPR